MTVKLQMTPWGSTSSKSHMEPGLGSVGWLRWQAWACVGEHGD